ncbi:MAG: valine--tRNA ligase [Clostridia bacterium]|nr:valine--tRNA ligase [Clostridia bacterium]
MNDKLNPKDFEERLYKEWEEKGYFKPSDDRSKETYCIMMPPPNVTGKLHMGHALDATLQDSLIRYKRMKGYRTLWLPGSDHASISTEMKVVEKLKKEGKSKHDIGREKFLEETWDWTRLYGGTIQKQQRALGCSCDWSRKRFTLDEGMSDAVLEQFVNLYNKGLIYKGKRMVNWCTNCNTSVSDIEVEYHEENTHLWHIRYKIVDEDKYVIVATTRPETMLGDTAVAVHPDDDRYKDIVGKKCILPIMNKEIPIIADKFVEKEFGTGCVKITPAHDMNDYQAGLNHDLEIIQVFDENFKMGNLVPEYEGMDLLEARKRIVEKLEEIGALVKTEDYVHNVGKCERCKSTIEPKISEQWFVSMESLAKPAIQAVKSGDISFVPKRYEKTYFNWMENIQDWCISRQLWWGHQIPAYYCEDCGHINVSKTAPEKCEKCGSTHLKQDEDTLDTWFSSALWPFSTLGWPNKTEDLEDFYPTDVLITGYDIIFFWVARMIFSGLYCTKKRPFKDILIHGIVRDSQGRKMSKSLGNGIDPLEIVDKYGTDSLRFSLLSGTSMGNDIRFMPEKLEQASNFCNKIWNAAKFVIMNTPSREKIIEFKEKNYDKENHRHIEGSLKIEDKWIISKLNILIKEVSENIENYDLGVAIDKIYGFLWNEFCDWYIEMCKSRIYSDNEEEKIQVAYVLDYVLALSLKLLHPFMPFITSEIYDSLVKYTGRDLMISSWPKMSGVYEVYDEETKFIESIKAIIGDIRNLRANMNVHPSKKSKLIFVTAKYQKEIEEASAFIEKLGFANEIVIQDDKKDIPENAVSVMAEDMEVYIPFDELVDLEEEKKRLDGEKKRLEAEVLRGEKMLSNPGFVNKAPEAKVEEERKKLENYRDMLKAVKERLEKM